MDLTLADLESRLTALAPTFRPDATRIANLRRLSGGATQEIFRFDLVDANGDATPLILRRAPGGERVSHLAIGLELEATLMQAAARAGVPVPRILRVLEPSDGLGHGFVMAFVPGETLGNRIVKSDELAAIRPTLARSCGEILARLHSIDATAIEGLEVLSPEAVLKKWYDTYRNTETRRPVFEAAFQSLRRRCPPRPARPSVVHGDFRNGNLMIGPDGVRAVLDWELAHAGDPIEDLGWLCVNSWRFGRVDLPVGGFGHYADLEAGYAAVTGRPVDHRAVRRWELFGTVKWGVLCAESLRMFRGEEHTVERAMIARRASETEIDLVRLLDEENG